MENLALKQYRTISYLNPEIDMLYLVTGVVTRSRYMSSQGVEKDVIRIVEADSSEMAANKFVAHFDDKTEEYTVYYHTSVTEVSEVIS